MTAGAERSNGDEGQVLAERERSFARACLGDGWTVRGALPGGHQQGALEVTRADGTRGVFKPGDGDDDAATLESKAAAIRLARDRGWPAAEWLAWGTFRDRPWVVQRFAEGRPAEGLSPALEDLVLSAVETQADVPNLPLFNWGERAEAIVRPDSYWRQRCESFDASSRALAGMLAAACAAAKDDDPPPRDLVHGDLATDNILECDGRITFIDTQSVGRGSRALDLTTMTVHCYAWEQGTRTAERFFGAAQQIAGAAAVRHTAARALGLMVFAMDNYPGFVGTLTNRLAALEGLRGWR